MSRRIRFPLKLTLRSPFMLQGLQRAAYGVDASALRDAEGRPLIPADHVKGLLRQAYQELAQPGAAHAGRDDVARLFGTESEEAAADGEQDVPKRASLVFSDLAAEDAGKDRLHQSGTFPRVAICDRTGSAQTGHLQVIELAAPLGAEVTFHGELTALAPPLEAAKLREDLQRALALIPAVGGFRSAGFGEVVPACSSVGDPDERDLLPAAPSGSDTPPTDTAEFVMRFDRPVLVDARRVADNYFQGATIVPGGAIKGALARRLELGGRLDDDLGRSLSQVVIGHAFPLSDTGHRLDTPLPASLVAAKDESTGDPRFADALLHTGAAGVLLGDRVPVFQGDWKGGWAAKFCRREDLPGSANLRRDTRTRTRIDSDTGVAADQALFSFSAVETRNTQWALTIQRNGIPPAHFELFCATLAGGLDGIGKTDARAELWREDAAPPKIEPVANDRPDQWAVTLLTPALLTDPGSRAPLREQYAAYWRDVLGDGVGLLNFFAQIRLAGGYQAVRYRLFGRRYFPFVLTEAGASFLLQGDVRDSLEGLARTGLPVARIREAEATDWRKCPFVPENGYGAITTNRVDHVRLAEGLTRVV